MKRLHVAILAVLALLVSTHLAVMIAQSLSDDFNRADGGLGANWTTFSVAPNIGGNLVTGTGGGYATNGALYTGTASADDQFSQFTIVGLDGVTSYAGATVRMTAGGNFYYCVVGNTNEYYIQEYNFGVLTTTHTTGTLGSSVAVSDVIRCEVTGTTITLKRNGVTVNTATDATHSSGAPGFVLLPNPTSTDVAIDDWSGGAVGGGGGGTVPKLLLLGVGQFRH